MPLTLSASDAALRLVLTLLAGLALGFNRSEYGKEAGMRTTLLVCLAASVAMMQVNLLLPLQGRSPSSFIMNDLMRFPLGILTGVGFIGAGAILHRDNLVHGVTTAATLWLATVVGLCIGAGLLWLGVVATVLGLTALWGLRPIERAMRQSMSACLEAEVDAGGPDEASLRRWITEAGLTIVRIDVDMDCEAGRRKYTFSLKQMRAVSDIAPPALIGQIADRPGIAHISWQDLR
jgi:putative Mg2+ transporter-C (MgtC) family protein